jgi:hypothetical protein
VVTLLVVAAIVIIAVAVVALLGPAFGSDPMTGT